MNDRFGKVYNYSEMPPLPQSLNIELNNTCNQECVFCPYHGPFSRKKLVPASIPNSIVKNIIDQAAEVGIGSKELGFYLAGEVFIRRDFEELVAYAKDRGFKYTFITTNGALAEPNRIKKVVDAGIDSIRFSINAADARMYERIHGRDDFNKVVDNIKFLRKYIDDNNLSVATSISCVITKKTKAIQNSIKMMFEEYVDDILFIPVILNRLNSTNEFRNEFELVDESKLEYIDEFICPMLFDTMYINANLEVVPCCDMYETEYAVYDLKKDFDLEKAWNSDRMHYYRDIFLQGGSMDGTRCSNCVLRMHGVERLVME